MFFSSLKWHFISNISYQTNKYAKEVKIEIFEGRSDKGKLQAKQYPFLHSGKLLFESSYWFNLSEWHLSRNSWNTKERSGRNLWKDSPSFYSRRVQRPTLFITFHISFACQSSSGDDNLNVYLILVVERKLGNDCSRHPSITTRENENQNSWKKLAPAVYCFDVFLNFLQNSNCHWTNCDESM